MLQEANAHRKPVSVMGAASKSLIGGPVDGAMALSTQGLRGISLYEPSERVIAVHAGTPLTQVETLLASQGQMLPFEPLDAGTLVGHAPGQATIGGVIAGGFGGARCGGSTAFARPVGGHVLGLAAISGKGDLIKCGGRTRKANAGYDLTRLLAGSWGTLAVLTEIVLNVVPLAAETGTLLIQGQPDEVAVDVLRQGLAASPLVTGAIHLQGALTARLHMPELAEQQRPVTALRLETGPGQLDDARDAVFHAIRAYGQVEAMDEPTSLAFWDEVRQLHVLNEAQTPLWRVSVAPTRAPALVKAVDGYLGARAFYDWGGGVVWMEVQPARDAGAADIRRLVATSGGHAMLVRASAEVRGEVDVFQPHEPAVQALFDRIKQAFDPAGILNPGRKGRSTMAASQHTGETQRADEAAALMPLEVT